MSNIEKYDNQITPDMPQTIGTEALQNLEAQANAMGNAMRIAEAMCSTEMVPKQFRNKPADGAAAILYGAELGLNAIQSLQQIMVINGKPGIEARTAVALLKKQGYKIRTVETSDTQVTVEGYGPDGEHETSTWTINRAAQAGYTSNKLYKTIPAQMLYAKAAMEVARKIAPHVLSGIAYSTEELQLEPVRMEARRVDAPKNGAAGLQAALGKKQTEPEPEAPSPIEQVQTAPTVEALGELMGHLQTEVDEATWEQLVEVADARAAELNA